MAEVEAEQLPQDYQEPQEQMVVLVLILYLLGQAQQALVQVVITQAAVVVEDKAVRVLAQVEQVVVAQVVHLVLVMELLVLLIQVVAVVEQVQAEIMAD